MKNKEVKVLIENLLSLSLLQVVGYILPLLTLPYIAKIIGVGFFGELAFATAIVVFFQTFVDFGFNYTGVRDISRIRDNVEEVSKVYSTIFYAKIILMIVSLIILIILIISFSDFYENRKVLFYTFSLIPGYILYPEWFFQGLEKMKYSAVLSTCIKIIFTILVFVLVKTKEDYIFIPIINGVGLMVVGIFAVLFIKKLGYRFIKVPLCDVWLMIKGSFDMFLTLILPNLYTNMSTIFLGNYWGRSSVGIFDAGNKFIGISHQFTNVLSRAFYPFLARKMEKHNFFERVSFIFSLLMSIGLFICAPLIVDLFYTTGFEEAIDIIRIMSITPIFIFMMNAYGTNYLVLKGKEQILRNIVLFCSLIGFFISWILVSTFSARGAATAITLVWAVRGGLTMYYAKKKVDI